MSEPSRVSNIAVLLVLGIVYTAFGIFIPSPRMMDIVSVPMLVFGLYGLYLLFPEAWSAFWAGERDRRALGLYGLTALLLSVVAMRPYGIITRNVPGADWLEDTHIYPVALSLQALGLWLFTRASETPTVDARRPGWGRIIIAFIIGVLVASSKMLEPLVWFVGKAISMLLGKA